MCDMDSFQCIFCGKTNLEGDLISMANNSIELEGEVIEFKDLINNLHCKLVNENDSWICDECKNYLINFQIFIENARQSQFLIHNEILKSVTDFIDENEHQEVIVKRYNKVLSLVPSNQQKFFDIFLNFQPQVTLEKFQDFQLLRPSSSDNIRIESLEEYVVESIIEDGCWIDEGDENEDEILTEIENETKIYLCKECDGTEISTFSDLEEYRKHLETVHSSGSNKIFSSTFMVVEEIEDSASQTKNPRKSFQRRFNQPVNERNYCVDCRYQFSTFSHFKAHQNGHQLFENVSKVTKFPTCLSCNFMFCDENSLKLHEINHESIPVEGNFLKIGVPKLEEEIIGNNENEECSAVKCGHCMKNFDDEELCKIHIYIFHVTSLECPLDKRSFQGNQAFTIHMRNYHPEVFNDQSIFKCKICNENFPNLYEKLKHMKSCDQKKFECHHCDKKFSMRCYLQAHLKQVSGATSIVCEICDKVCKNKGDYNVHFRSHTNDKPFQCSLCPKAYKTSSARAAHIQTHSEVGFYCKLCNQKFKARRILQKHVKTKH